MPRGAVGENEEPATLRRRARPWRWLTVGGGALMAVTFFLPAVTSCNSDVVPVDETFDVLARPLGEDWLDGLLSKSELVMYLPAYLVGALLALAALGRLRGWTRPARWCGRAALGVVLLPAVLVPAGVMVELVQSGGGVDLVDPFVWFEIPLFFVVPLWTLLGLILARKNRALRYLCRQFAFCVWMVVWFGMWVVLGDALYGVHLSLAAGGILLVGVVGEARALTGQTWRRTIGQLCMARLAPRASVKGRCPRCDYPLYGLSALRCPECGRSFTLEEADLSADELAASANLGGFTGPAL